MSLLDWLRRHIGAPNEPGIPGGLEDPNDPDPVRREATQLYAALYRESLPLRPYFDIATTPTGRRILHDTAPDLQLAVAEIAFRAFYASTQGYRQGLDDYYAAGVIKQVLARRPQPTPDRVAALLYAAALMRGGYTHWFPMATILSLVSKPPAAIEAEALRHYRDATLKDAGHRERKLIKRIEEMLDGDGPRPLRAGGTWSARVLRELEAFDPETRAAWDALIRHLLDSRSTDPSQKWLKTLGTHLDAVGREAFLDRTLAWLAPGPMPDNPTTPQVPEADANYLKGFVWALGTFEDAAAARALADLAIASFRKVPNHGAICSRAGNACVRMLGSMQNREAVAQLGRLRTHVKYAVALQLIEKALADAASRHGLAPADLEELAVPTFDLDATGTLTRTIGDAVAEVRITGTLSVEWSWRMANGHPQKSVPASVRESHAGELTRLKKTIKDLLAMLPAQRARLERLLESDRAIPYDAWRARYLEHPLLGEMTRRLIWHFSSEVEHAGVSTLGGLHDGQILDVDDQPIPWLSSSTVVRLWHPLGFDPGVVLAWRRFLERHAIVQPFKQAHRELYLLTDAELATRTYSNRFAAHILRQHQFAALCRERGWTYSLQGDWDSANTPHHRLPRWDLQVYFEVGSQGDRDRGALATSGVFQFVTTNHVLFYRNDAVVPLSDVPALAFSEAMRDIDLFVGVCSVGNDPTWIDGGLAPTYQDYWGSYASGPLAESARTRREVLERLIPRLKIADRLQLDDRFLIVRGDLASYKIHLGSTNILMEPGSRYLCIVPDRRRATPSATSRDIWLPFEGDAALAIIISKALLLAADATITDPVIVRQIRR